ncbi:MAG TPA: hypothetical protein VHZ81_14040 [Galbitalea sp.]|jgi:hypothetical protein|nr:hypothetical protein [Galbitalea sp.]
MVTREIASKQREIPDVHAWTGRAAFGVAAFLLAEFIVRETEGSRPPLSHTAALISFMAHSSMQTLIIVTLDAVLMAFLIVFLAAFRQLVTAAFDGIEWVADLVYGSGLVFVGIQLVGDAMEGGAALDASSASPDVSVLRALTEGHILLFGSIGCVLLALVAAASGYVILASGALPKWTGRVAFVVAGLNIIAVPTLFGGTSDTSFLAAGGLGVTVFATFPWLAWVIIVGAVTVRGYRPARPGLLRVARLDHGDHGGDQGHADEHGKN